MSKALAITDDAALFRDPDFTKAMQEETKRRAQAAFHGCGMERLIAIANGADDKTAITAINLLGKLAGEFKAPKPVVLSFDELIKKAAASAGPLAGITQIREAEVIEADDDNGDTTE